MPSSLGLLFKPKKTEAVSKARVAAHVSGQPVPEPHTGTHRKLSPARLPASSDPQCPRPWPASVLCAWEVATAQGDSTEWTSSSSQALSDI